MMLKKKLELGLVIREKGRLRSPRYQVILVFDVASGGRPAQPPSLAAAMSWCVTSRHSSRRSACMRQYEEAALGKTAIGWRVCPLTCSGKKYSSNRRVLVDKVGDAPSCRGLCLKTTQ